MKANAVMIDNRTNFLSLMAIGDAYGMKYEFLAHDIPVNESDLTYGAHPKFPDYQVGHYTDDTQMSLANAELLMQKQPEKIERLDFVCAWIEVFQRDPRLGYSKYMFGVMSSNPSPEEFCSRLDASRGTTSGAAMRAAPLGLLNDLALVKRLTCDQAAATHDTVAGITSALIVSLSTHFLHHGGKPDHLKAFLSSHLETSWEAMLSDTTVEPGHGMKIVGQAMSSLKDKTSLSQILVAGVSQTEVSDTDTICTIAMAIASRRSDLLNDLPRILYQTIENGAYGIDYLREIDTKLQTKFPPSQQYRHFTP